MKINAHRVASFFRHHKNDILTPQFWSTFGRVVKNRFNVWERVGRRQFQDNLAAIERRPWNLHIELTNLCNADCIFCAYQYQTRPKIFIKDEIFTKALDDYCAIGGGDLMLEAIVGDPAIDPNFLARVRQARARPEIASIETITNGIALRDIPALVRSRLTKMQISTGPWRRDLYEKIYRTTSYERMRKNVRELLEENVRAGSPLQVTIAFRSNLSMKETVLLPDYREIAHLPHRVVFNTDFDTWRGEIKAEDLLQGMAIRHRSVLEREPCIWLYDGPIIFENGDVGMCGCRDFNANSELIVGNIMKSTLLEIWQSERVRALREGFRRGQYPLICQQCATYANLDLYRTSPGSARARATLYRIQNARGADYSSEALRAAGSLERS